MAMEDFLRPQDYKFADLLTELQDARVNRLYALGGGSIFLIPMTFGIIERRPWVAVASGALIALSLVIFLYYFRKVDKLSRKLNP